jgi:hypothetical protein
VLGFPANTTEMGGGERRLVWRGCRPTNRRRKVVAGGRWVLLKNTETIGRWRALWFWCAGYVNEGWVVSLVEMPTREERQQLMLSAGNSLRTLGFQKKFHFSPCSFMIYLLHIQTLI